MEGIHRGESVSVGKEIDCDGYRFNREKKFGVLMHQASFEFLRLGRKNHKEEKEEKTSRNLFSKSSFA